MMERVLGPLPSNMLRLAEYVLFIINLADLPYSNHFFIQLDVLICSSLIKFSSRDAEKYIRRGRLNWPESATSSESVEAVLKLPMLQVFPS